MTPTLGLIESKATGGGFIRTSEIMFIHGVSHNMET